MTELEKQIDAAYDFRGHVTIKLKDGKTVEGFIFNRQFAGPKLKREPFIEVVLKGSGEKTEIVIARLESVALTGDNCAAGKSYEDYLKKKAAEASSKKA
jgi:hypothetical protein